MKTHLIQPFASFSAIGGLRFGTTPHVRQAHHPDIRPTAHCRRDHIRAGSHQLLMSDRSDDSGVGCFDEKEKDVNHHHGDNVSRRSLLHSAGLSFAGYVSSGPFLSLIRSFDTPDPSTATATATATANTANRRVGVANDNVANAVGLVQFPCHPGELHNIYYMMRAGESGLEAENVLSTNPLFLTNREDALTELGMAQVEEACSEMMSKGINPSVVKYSLASKCIDAANVVATTMMVGRNRIVPEFTFMDPRGAGVWDSKPLASTEAAIWAMDEAEAGNEGRNGKPPANDDGTANETLFDQVIRLRQLMSVLETQYSGDSILLIFPDGTSPALLSCLIAGIPLKHVHALNYMPGELREDVNMENSLQLLKERMSSPTYNEMLSVGREELAKLREEERLKLLEKEQYTKPLLNKPVRQADPISDKEFAFMKGPKLSLDRKDGEMKAQQYAVERARRLTDRENSETSPDKTTTLGPDFFSAGAVGAMGSMVMLRPDKDDDSIDSIETTKAPEESKPYTPVLAYANATGSMVFEQPTRGSLVPSLTSDTTIRSSPTTVASIATPVASTATTAVSFVVDADAGLFDPNVFEDVPVLSKQERVESAEKAMEEYLSQDDGGDGWLASMQDIMGED